MDNVASCRHRSFTGCAAATFSPCVGHIVGQISAVGIAGSCESKNADNGLTLFSFSMATINTYDHLLTQRMYKPTDEKRKDVILRPD